jgi:hypothetical protein
MEEKRWGMFIFCSILAGLTKEQVWLQVGLMGLAIAWKPKTRLLGSIVALVSGATFYVLLWHVIPNVTASGQHFALSYFSEFGSDQNGVLRGMLLEPWKVLSTLGAFDRQYYLFQLFAPVGFLALLSPWTLIFAAPNLAINILSNNWLMRLIDFQYTSTVTPFLFIAAVEGWRMVRIRLGNGWGRGALYGWAFAWLLASVYLYAEIPFGKESKLLLYTTPQAETTIMNLLIREIPSTASVSVTNNIGAHVSQREFLYNFPIATNSADYVLAKIDNPNAWPSLPDQVRVVQELLTSPNHRLLIQTGFFYAFQRK